MKKLTLLLFLVTLLISRDNPFKPIETSNAVSNNNQDKFDKLKDEKIFLPSSARVVKSIKITYQNIDGSINEITKEYDKEIDWHKPIEIKHNIAEIIQKEEGKFIDISMINKRIKLSYLNRNLKMKTNDPIDKHFFLSKPFRVVIDFKGEFKGTEKENLNGNFFKKLAVSGHDKFYRVVVELDSFYKYLITEIDGGYILGIR